MYTIAAISQKKKFHMNGFIKSLEITEDAAEVFCHLQHFHPRRRFELKKWTTNSEEVSAAIPEDLKSIRKTHQIEVEHHMELFSEL